MEILTDNFRICLFKHKDTGILLGYDQLEGLYKPYIDNNIDEAFDHNYFLSLKEVILTRRWEPIVILKDMTKKLYKNTDFEKIELGYIKLFGKDTLLAALTYKTKPEHYLFGRDEFIITKDGCSLRRNHKYENPIYLVHKELLTFTEIKEDIINRLNFANVGDYYIFFSKSYAENFIRNNTKHFSLVDVLDTIDVYLTENGRFLSCTKEFFTSGFIANLKTRIKQ